MDVSRQMISLEEARAIIDRTLTPLVLQAERIAVGDAVGRVLAADQIACLDLPPFGLPGNPVAVFLTFHLLVLWTAARLSNTPWPVRTLRLPLATEFCRRKAQRQEYWPCRLNDQGQLVPQEFHGTAHLAGLRDADGLMAVPIQCTELAAGERVEFLPVGRLFG